jgi:hypothetical protein
MFAPLASFAVAENNNVDPTSSEGLGDVTVTDATAGGPDGPSLPPHATRADESPNITMFRRRPLGIELFLVRRRRLVACLSIFNLLGH